MPKKYYSAAGKPIKYRKPPVRYWRPAHTYKPSNVTVQQGQSRQKWSKGGAAGAGHYTPRIQDNRTELQIMMDEDHDRIYEEIMMMREEDYTTAYVGTALKKYRLDNYWKY